MNWEQIEKQWHSLKDLIQNKWAKISESDFNSIACKKDQLLAKIQEHYGLAKDKAEKDLEDFVELFKKREKTAEAQPHHTEEASKVGSVVKQEETISKSGAGAKQKETVSKSGAVGKTSSEEQHSAEQ